MRRRFAQNQEDCTFTVLALLPTAADNILEALPVEAITLELQQHRSARRGQSAPSATSPSDLSSNASGEDGRSLKSFQTESFVHASQTATTTEGSQSPEPRKTKSQLWNELKISSITRSLTLVYTLALLSLFTRIQLNLLGRRSYVLSVVALTSQKPAGTAISLENDEERTTHGPAANDFETTRRVLAFSWWRWHRGWRSLMTREEAAVVEVFGPINPREELTFQRLAELLLETRKKIEGASGQEREKQNWLSYIMPPLDQEDHVMREAGVLGPLGQAPNASESQPQPPPAMPSLATSSERGPSNIAPSQSSTSSLRRLLDESSDIIESPRFTDVLTRLLDTLFSELTDTAIRTQAFRHPEPAAAPSLTIAPPEPQIGEAVSTRVKLANVMAVITRQAHAIGNGMPNVYVQAMEQVPELESLAVVVFSSDFDLDEITQAQQTAGISTPPGTSGQALTDKAQEDDAVGSSWGLFESVWRKVAG